MTGDAQVEVDRWKASRGYLPRARPKAPADPHVIAFADGCGSWLTYPSEQAARDALARLDTMPSFVGATVVRNNGDVPSWTTCREHLTAAGR